MVRSAGNDVTVVLVVELGVVWIVRVSRTVDVVAVTTSRVTVVLVVVVLVVVLHIHQGGGIEVAATYY